jgi:hypothetical protein
MGLRELEDGRIQQLSAAGEVGLRVRLVVVRFETATGAVASELVDSPACVRAAGAMGVTVGLGGDPLVLELYPNPATLGAHLRELLCPSVLDAVAQPVPAEAVPDRRARSLADRLNGLKAQPRMGVDTTTPWRWDSRPSMP